MEWNWILEEYMTIWFMSAILNNYELLYVNRADVICSIFLGKNSFWKKYLCYEIFHGRNTPCRFFTNNYLKIQDFMSGSIITNSWGKAYLLKDRRYCGTGGNPESSSF